MRKTEQKKKKTMVGICADISREFGILYLFATLLMLASCRTKLGWGVTLDRAGSLLA
jgi:hypothetical protein